MPLSGYTDSYNPSSTTTSYHSPYPPTPLKKLKTRQYYRVAPISQVDESLFGSSQRNKGKTYENKNINNNNNLNIDSFALKRGVTTMVTNNKYNSNNNLQVDRSFSADNQRFRGGQPIDPLVISRRDFERLMMAATAEPMRMTTMRMAEQERCKEKIVADVEARKERMKTLEVARRRELSDFELENKLKSDVIRSRALEKMVEEEDEIKKLNKWIAGTKCHVIREVQMMEKKEMKEEVEMEERRMERVVEDERMKSMVIDEEIEKRKKEEQMIGALQIMQQIQRNEQNKLLELEEKDQEGIMMQKYLDNLCVEEVEKIKARKMEQKRIRDELKESNAEIIQKKRLQRQQEKLMDEEVMHFQKAKEDLEAEREREQQAMKQAREREYAKLRALQERSRDEQAERDEVRARRALEQSEREWRRKETEAAAARAAAEADLIESRELQRRQKQQSLALQAHREKVDFDRIIKHQQGEIERIKREEEVLKRRRVVFSKEIQQQIKEKEERRVIERGRMMEEDSRMEDEERKRRMRLQQVKEKKMQELREAGIEEKYLGQIEKKVMGGGAVAKVNYQHRPLLV